MNTTTHDLSQDLFPLYKPKPPFMEFTNGYGFQGVIMLKKSTGKIQCHICGEFKKSISKHVYHAHDKMTSTDYRDLVGLNKTTPLVCPGTSLKIRENFTMKPKAERERISQRLLKLMHEGRRKHGFRGFKKTRGTMQEKNTMGSCDLQIKHRFITEMTKLGVLPTTTEISASLRSMIYSRFSSYDDALRAWGFSEREISEKEMRGEQKYIAGRKKFLETSPDLYSKDKVKKQLLSFNKEFGRLPTWGECGLSSDREGRLPGRQTILRLFNITNKDELERELGL